MTGDPIPAELVRIYWATEDSRPHRVSRVLVLRKGAPDELIARRDRTLRFSHGCGFTDWLQDETMTPEFVFGELVQSGFVHEAVARHCIAEFARIAGCGWARAMLPGGRA